MNDNFSSKKIQNDLIKLTGYKYPVSYINNTIKVIFENIILSKRKKIMISGAQGSGKTTLIKLIELNFKNFYNIKPLCISLDDFYLSIKKRNVLARKIHPFLLTRGVPGTHDTEKILEIIKQFNKKNYPIKIPKFNKLHDNREKNIKKISEKKDILFFEGWCCGCQPISKIYLRKKINILEKKDKNCIWRNYYNKKLSDEYKMIFKHFNYLIYFKINNFKDVIEWRYKQEKGLASLNSKKIKHMNKYKIKKFVTHYEKITKWMMQNKGNLANLIIKIDKNQKIKKII
tara:strand:+ start:617 stop:1477 length:861 start_codon:yes stop_codon:yes gene_type:complete